MLNMHASLFMPCSVLVLCPSNPPTPPPRLMHTHIQHVLVLIVCAVCPHYRPFCSTGLMFVLGPQNGRAQPKMGKRIRDDTGGCVMVVKGGLGVLPWCLAPNGIRGEQPRKGNKVKLRCCQLRLTTSWPDSGGTGALSRHRSHSPFTPFSLSTHPFISNSFFSHFIVLLHPPPPRPNAPPASCQRSVMQQRRAGLSSRCIRLNQTGNRKTCNQTSILGPLLFSLAMLPLSLLYCLVFVKPGEV